MFLGATNTKFSKISAKEFASFFHTLIIQNVIITSDKLPFCAYFCFLNRIL